MTTHVTHKSGAKRPSRVEIIDGRRVKVANDEEVKATSKRLMVKYSRALDILKNR